MVLEMLHCKELQLFSLLLLLLLLEMQTLNLNSPLVQASAVQKCLLSVALAMFLFLYLRLSWPLCKAQSTYFSKPCYTKSTSLDYKKKKKMYPKLMQLP